MPSVLALISKAVFGTLPPMQLSDVTPLDRYTSKHAIFDTLGPDDALFLVAVRPKGLLLVAVIDRPKRKGAALVGATNTTPCRFIKISRLKLADGKGLTATLDKLGMSLQTPRMLSEGDVALLRGKVLPSSPKSAAPVIQMKIAGKQNRELLEGGKLGAKAKVLVEQIYKAPGDRALRAVLADQLLEDQHVWGELISLQLDNPKQHRDRIAAIIRQHARDIVGEIANVAAREDLEIVDGFLVAARCGKSSSFTSAAQRRAAAMAPQWATVKSLTLTIHTTNLFLAELLRNPASAQLVQIRKETKISIQRASPDLPWQIGSAEHCRHILDSLPIAEIARIPMPAQPKAQVVLAAARAARLDTPRKSRRR